MRTSHLHVVKTQATNNDLMNAFAIIVVAGAGAVDQTKWDVFFRSTMRRTHIIFILKIFVKCSSFPARARIHTHTHTHLHNINFMQFNIKTTLCIPLMVYLNLIIKICWRWFFSTIIFPKSEFLFGCFTFLHTHWVKGKYC